MRGWTADGQGDVTRPNIANADDNGANSALPTSTGFKLHTTNNEWNGSGDTYMYVAIRRADGYVGKPPSLGTGVFAMDTGNGSSTIPSYDSGFPVDFALSRVVTGTDDWGVNGRLIGTKKLNANTTGAESSWGDYVWDSNVGWAKGYASTIQSWMWKRHAGFDVVTWEGQNIQPGVIPHSLNKVPEMMWLRKRSSGDWEVYHKGLNGGSSPETYSIKINESDAEVNFSRWYSTVPSSTHFTVTKNYFNASNENYIAMLFASVDGISKVGSYTGNGNTGQTITLGFQPRFVIIKYADGARGWVVLDTLRGWVNGNDKYIRLDTANAQFDWNTAMPTSTGFTLPNNEDSVNENGGKYIYYAHA